MPKKLVQLGFLLLAGLAVAGLFGMIQSGPRAQADPTQPWFVEFESQIVPPISRDDTTQMIEAGTIETEGFSELVFSLGGEFKKNVPESGKVGVILIPDEEPFIFLMETEGKFAFPLEVAVPVTGERMFISEQNVARVAFSRYRAYLYNESNSTAHVVLYIYRSR